MLHKIPKYNERGDPAKCLNGFKIHMGLRGATQSMKYRAFHLTLSRVVEVKYIRFQARSI